MPAKRQKLRHRHVPLSEAFSVEDTPYVPPSNLTEHLGMKLQTERRMPKEVAPTRIPRPKKRNSRDPFHALNDDAVHLIIELLPARDTEIMRRVSKLWKASSEYRCGKSALVRHFPWAAPKAERCETNEAANLLFRRCLYLQQSLEAGFATRALRCDGVSDWDIHENRLMWTKGDGDISIRDMRKPDDTSIIDLKIMNFDTSHILPPNAWRLYVRILPGGDFLMTTRIVTKIDTENVPPVDRLQRISAQGKVAWSVDLEACTNRPAIGKHNFYFVRSPWQRADPTSGKKRSFAKNRLCDGSMVFHTIMPADMQADITTMELDRSLTLSEGECVASWKMNYRGDLQIFSTSSGQHIMTIQERDTTDGPLCVSVLPSFHTSGFWSSTSHTLRLFTFNETQRSHHDEDCGYYFRNNLADPSVIAFDGGRWMILRIINADDTVSHDRTIPFGKFSTLPANLFNAHRLPSPEYTTVVTLPGRSKAEGKRRDLELELPRKLEKGDFFGMMNDYLIFYSREDEMLVLVDFWPVW